ncbi:MAG: hypothetical protein J6M60_00250 [Clostridia bacterium]|nr:hypothetical protein [Clostridia bacterium]
MKRRVNVKLFVMSFVAIILFLLQLSIVYAAPDDEVTDENVGEYSTRHPENFGIKVTVESAETEAEMLAKLKSEGEENNEVVNYYTIRYMSLTEDYSKEIMDKKYQTMDQYIRWMSKLSWNDDYSNEKSRLVYKIGIIKTIDTLKSGAVVFTLEDNPSKRFLIDPKNDWAFQRFVSEPGDLVQLVTTTDRRVYHFDNWSLTRGQNISFDDFNHEHPEDSLIEGFFPSCLYKERIEKYGVPNEAIGLMIEYTDPWLEDYYGECNRTYFKISSEYAFSDEDWNRYWTTMNSSCDEIINESLKCEDLASRDDLEWKDIDVTNVDGYIIARKEYIREFEISKDGTIEFTTWESPTRSYHFSNEYDSQNFVDVFSENQRVFMYYNADTREVYYMKIK